MKANRREFFLSTREVAAAAGAHEITVLRAAKKGAVPFTLTPGGHYRFGEAAIDTIRHRLHRSSASAA